MSTAAVLALVAIVAFLLGHTRRQRQEIRALLAELRAARGETRAANEAASAARNALGAQAARMEKLRDELAVYRAHKWIQH